MCRRCHPALALLLVASLCVARPPCAHSQALGDGPLTRAEAESLFVAHSPQWRALRSDAIRQIQDARVPALWPNPSIEAEQERGLPNAQRTYLLDQPVPNPWAYAARGDVADATVRQARATYREGAAGLLFDLRTRYLEAVTARMRVAVLDSLTQIVRRAVEAGEVRFEEGAINAFEMKRLHLAAAQYASDQADARTRSRTARDQLARLLRPERSKEVVTGLRPERQSSSPDTTYPVPGALQYRPVARSEPTLRARALKDRGRLDSARAAVAAGRSALRREKAARVPGVSLRGGLVREPGGGEAEQGAVIGLGVEIPLFHQNGTQVEAARAQRTAAQASLASTRRGVAQDVRSAYTQAESLEQRIDTLDVIQPDSVRSFLDQAVYLYREGQVSLVELLDAVGAARDARMLRVDLLSRHRRARFALTRAVGTLPDTLPPMQP